MAPDTSGKGLVAGRVSHFRKTFGEILAMKAGASSRTSDSKLASTLIEGTDVLFFRYNGAGQSIFPVVSSGNCAVGSENNMPDGKSTHTFVYETSRHKALMDEYAHLSTPEHYLDWGKKAPAVAAYMSATISRVRMGIVQEKARLNQESDKRQKRGIEMALMQLENFQKILEKQLDHLIKAMDNLPTGSVKSVFEELIKPKLPTPDSPYVKILVTKSGEVVLDGNVTSIDALKVRLTALVRQNGSVLYSREAPANGAPPDVVKTVIDLVIGNRLPIQICQKTDFSDAVAPDGKLRIQG